MYTKGKLRVLATNCGSSLMSGSTVIGYTPRRYGGEANAERLVKCWNEHDELVKHLKRLVRFDTKEEIKRNFGLYDLAIKEAKELIEAI